MDTHLHSDPDSYDILHETKYALLNLILQFLSVLLIVCGKYTHNLLQFIIYINNSNIFNTQQ